MILVYSTRSLTWSKWPTAIRGGFDADYLRLPKEVLITVMKKHQRYFPVIGNKETSRQADKAGKPLVYLSTCSTPLLHHRATTAAWSTPMWCGRVTRVLIFAVDADAALTSSRPTPRRSWRRSRRDLPRSPSRRSSARCWTRCAVWSSSCRRSVECLALSGADLVMMARAASLCKSDLATQMVVEMTSLQGIMGLRKYARLSGESDAVGDRVSFEHYLPGLQGDSLPTTQPGLALGIANRLDSLVGLFAVGLAPDR